MHLLAALNSPSHGKASNYMRIYAERRIIKIANYAPPREKDHAPLAKRSLRLSLLSLSSSAMVVCASLPCGFFASGC